MLNLILTCVWAGIRGNELLLASVPERLVITRLENASGLSRQVGDLGRYTLLFFFLSGHLI